MPWPSAQDYQEGMQNPRVALSDPELQAGRAEEDQLGLPRPICGTFASVYKVICPSRAWAVRCFLREFLDQQKRYAAISAQLARSHFAFATHFEFLTRGIRVRGNWYPVLKMEWVEGESLARFISNNLQSSQKLLSLALQIVDIARELNRAGVAHGDLQHGNILVANGKAKLIDYDGMYVPACQGWGSHERGHRNYQLPSRSELDFGPGVDNFSVWVIYLSLLALSVQPGLWTRFQGGDDCLLFRREDFENPTHSLILEQLKQSADTELRQQATTFEALLQLSPLQVPMIDPGAPTARPGTRPTPDWLRDHLPPQSLPPPPSVFNLSKQWALIEQIIRPDSTYQTLQVPRLSPIPWPFSTTPPLPPPVPEILVTPPAIPVLELPPPACRPAKVPVEPSQRLLGIAALSFAALAPFLGAFAGLVGLRGFGNPIVNAAMIAIGFMLGAMFLGMLWQILELNRSKEEQELNREYEEEMAERQALQRKHLDRCMNRFNQQKEAATNEYNRKVFQWNEVIKPYKKEAERRRKALDMARANLNKTEQQWIAASVNWSNRFDYKKEHLFRLKAEYDEVEAQRSKELEVLLAKAKELQRKNYLNQHLIEYHDIPDIGPGRKKRLLDNGIRTALDVDEYRIIGIPGFGEKLTRNLIFWRNTVNSRFVFRAAMAIRAADQQAFEAKYDYRRNLIQKQLLVGEQELRQISRSAEQELAKLYAQIGPRFETVRQAEADMTVIPDGL